MSLKESASIVDPQPAELFCYLPSYKVVVCTTCQYAVQPQAIPRHLKEIHHIHRGRRKPFMQYVAKLELSQPDDVLKSEVYEFPVPSIPIQDGFRCKDCTHLCVSEKRMKSHWVSVHGRQGQSSDWKPAPLQTFFRGNLLRYFTASDVLPKLSSTSDDEVCIRGHKPSNLPQYTNTRSDSDIVLLNHYITSTSTSIAHDELSKVLWQKTVPELADQHDFLMHGILACSALHLAYKYPHQRQYLIEASSHQSIAMPLFRLAIENVNEDNCHSIMAFSHLLVIYSFALERHDERLLIVEGDGTSALPTWLYFLRNGCLMVCSCWDLIETGPVKDLASQWEVPVEVSAEGRLPLIEFLLSAIPLQNSQYEWSENECRLYTDTAIELGQAFAYARTLGERITTWDALRVWPMLVSVEFMHMLNDWHPGGLILLAHYCIILKAVETNWYFTGRATKLLSTIVKRLDERWLCFIQLPLEEIGSHA